MLGKSKLESSRTCRMRTARACGKSKIATDAAAGQEKLDLNFTESHLIKSCYHSYHLYTSILLKDIMSLATNISQLTTTSTTSTLNKSNVFQDLPLMSKHIRLTVTELRHSDKQVINELVYRWCRILTRNAHKLPGDCQVVLIDMIASINPIRLATILKRDSGRMRLINFIRQSKINSTYITLSSFMKRDIASNNSPKLFVIYHDEFFIVKTLSLLRDFLSVTKSQVLLAVPKLDRQERDVLNLISTNQILRCDFKVNRREIGPIPPDSTNESYSNYLNQVTFQRYSMNKDLPDKVEGELREDGLHLHTTDLKPTTIKQQQKSLGKVIMEECNHASKKLKSSMGGDSH